MSTSCARPPRTSGTSCARAASARSAPTGAQRGRARWPHVQGARARPPRRAPRQAAAQQRAPADAAITSGLRVGADAANLGKCSKCAAGTSGFLLPTFTQVHGRRARCRGQGAQSAPPVSPGRVGCVQHHHTPHCSVNRARATRGVRRGQRSAPPARRSRSSMVARRLASGGLMHTSESLSRANRRRRIDAGEPMPRTLSNNKRAHDQHTATTAAAATARTGASCAMLAPMAKASRRCPPRPMCAHVQHMFIACRLLVKPTARVLLQAQSLCRH